MKVPEGLASLDATLTELAEIGSGIRPAFQGTYTREVIYGDHD